jgi:predicted thioesterase
MKATLKPGASLTRKVEVDDARVISFMGDDGRVYSTPSLVGDMEYTCRDLVLAHLDEGEDSVGTRVEINHTAATPYGMEAEITATIAKVDGRAVTIEFTARDLFDEIGNGKHHRFVVDVAKAHERILAKRAKAGLK